VLLALLAAPDSGQDSADWPRFRGPNGSGIAPGSSPLPERLEPGKTSVWSRELPPGISSPVLAGGRIYVTALREKDLLTIALDRASGAILWERKAPAERIEETHSTSSPAAASCAADGSRVVSFFGSYGLIAHDADGNEIWKLPLAPLNNPFGAASSPVIAGDMVILVCDQDRGSFLIALDKTTGKKRWRTERPQFPRGYSTPVLWERGGRTEIVVPGTLELKGYALDDGKELWSAAGLARIVNPTAILGDGILFVASFSPGGDAGERIAMPPFDEYAAANDADKDGRLVNAEVPAGEMKSRFLQLDADKDGFITRAEWDTMSRIFDAARNGIIAFRPDGEKVAKAWEYARGVPYVPSPIYHEGHVYMVKDGGIFTSLRASTGELVKQGRLPAGGNYYASPVIGDGKIYVASLAGEVTTIAARPQWEVLASSPLGEGCAATPAIAGGRIYVRTEKRLLAFEGTGEPAR
jgi:outer membrane protein assembly factor BamB